ncbi:MAG: hypothetical protein JNK61_00440 [Bacteroidia bacterium]|nr:hypothetical protein [Bacteroidia bacterium]
MIGKFKSKSFVSVFAVAIIWLCIILNLGYYKKQNVIVSDAVSYYSYLPAFFIQHDLGLQFLSDTNFIVPANAYWHHKSHTNKPVFKMTMGWAIMYLPAFIVADTYMKVVQPNRTGFETPYHLAIALFTLLYAVMALCILRMVLLSFFDESVTALTLLIVALTTNVTCYVTVEGGSVHMLNFCLACALIYYTIQWHRRPLYKYMVAIGFTIAILALIRPTNLIWILFPLLYNVTDLKSFAQKIKHLVLQQRHWITLVVCCMLIVLPQVLYWHQQTGKWIYYSYTDEGFFWLSPKLYQILFSFRKGWFIYTPVMFLAVMGLTLMPRRLNNLFVPVTVVFFLALYITACWWCWWYGGSYGMRPLIDFYPLLALPLACILQQALQVNRKFLLLLLMVLTVWNLYTTYQYKRNVLHYDSMTAKAYKQLFLHFSAPVGYDKLLNPPNYEAAKKNAELQ